MSARMEMVETREALRFVRATGATISRIDSGRVTLQAGDEEHIVSAHRFEDYRTAKERRLFVTRAYILPAVEEDGLYVHAAWIGGSRPILGTPKMSKTGRPYLQRYVDGTREDGTWISLMHSEPLNTGRISKIGESRLSADFVELEADVVVADVLVARGEYFAMYNYSRELLTGYAVAHSSLENSTKLRMWSDRQATASLSVPRSSQGEFTLSAYVRYGSFPAEEHRTTSLSLSATGSA